MKKLFLLLIAMAITLCLAACGEDASIRENDTEVLGEHTGDNSNQQTDDWEEEIPNQEITDFDYAEYGVDLSAYDDHGEWSSDRMWVKKIENSWDEVKTYYGYIDREGNLVGQWHEKGYIMYDERDKLDAFVNDQSALSPWSNPNDFVGNYAMVGCGDCTEIIDLQGNTVVKYAYYSVSTFAPRALQFGEDKLVLFYYPHNDRDNLHMMTVENGSAKDRIVIENAELCAPKDVKTILNFGFACCNYNFILEKSEFALMDLDGNLLVYGTTTYEVVDIYPSNGEAAGRIVFIGADENEWVVDVDAYGNWLTEPVAY